MKISKRNSNIELLRIISMIMIVLHHYTVHNGVNNIELPFGINKFLLETSALGNIGVIIFILITGYYCINSEKPFKLKRLVSLIFQTFFYSAIIYLVFVAIGAEEFSRTGLVHNFMPVLFSGYWFITTYVVLYIFTPFLNTCLKNLSRKKHLQLIMIMTVLFAILPNFLGLNAFLSPIMEFFLFYSIGAYLGAYKDNFFSRKRNRYLVLFISAAAILLLVLACHLLGNRFPIFAAQAGRWLCRESIFAIIFSVALFSIFANKKPFTSNALNKISACMLGVYLLHDNDFVRHALWIDIFKNADYVDKPMMILHFIGSVAVVFVVCVLIEFVRQQTVERVFSAVYDRAEAKIKKRLMARK